MRESHGGNFSWTKLVDRISEILFFPLIIILASCLIYTAHSVDEEEKRAALLPPNATQDMAWDAARGAFGWWGEEIPFPGIPTDPDAPLQVGTLGVYIPNKSLQSTLGMRPGFWQYRQPCPVTSLGDLGIKPEERTIIVPLSAPLEADRGFLQRCERQVEKYFYLVVITVEKIPQGFQVEFRREAWKTKVVFRLRRR